MKPNTEKILDRVRKLYALAEGGASEAEAAAAIAKAQQLLLEHNLSLMDARELDDAETFETMIMDSEIERYNEQWRRSIMGAVARLYMCHYHFEKTRVDGVRSASRQTGVRHVFSGRPHNVEIAKSMGIYLVKTVSRLANEGWGDHKKTLSYTPSRTELGRYIMTFRLAAAVRLRQRIDEMVRAARAGTVMGSDGRNLPALANMMDVELKLIEGYLGQLGMTFKMKKSRAVYISTSAYDDGTEAGNGISLSTQIGGKSSSAPTPLPSARHLLTGR